MEKVNEGGVHLFAFHGQHSENDFKKACNLSHVPEACGGIHRLDLPKSR